MDKLGPVISRLIDGLLRVRNSSISGNVDDAKLNSDQLKQLKTSLRQSESLLEPFFDYVLNYYLRKDNVITRLYAVLLIDEIFRRSHRFREYVVDNFEDFLKFSVETDPLHHPLPAPKNLAKILKERTLKIIHEWYNSFGSGYRKLQLAYEYLKSCKTFDFQRIEAETIVERERSEKERRRQEQTKERVVKKVSDDLQDIEDDMENCVTEMSTAFRLLVPEFATDDDITTTNSTTTNAQDEEPSTSGLQAHGIPLSTYGLTISIPFGKSTIEPSQDNVDLINTLRDCNKLIIGRYFPKIRQLLNIVSRYGGDERITKNLLDWRMRLEDSKKKFDDLNLDSGAFKTASPAADDEDGDFEVVPEKEGLETEFRPPSPDVPEHIRDWSKSVSVNAKNGTEVHTSSQSSTGGQIATKSDIPALPFGLDLKYWGEEKLEKPMIVRNNADCHRFWRPTDGEDAIQISDMEAEAYHTRVIPFAGQFQPVERECKTPLSGKPPSDKLCTRRDRYRCPFHGVILSRDDRGRPLEPMDESTSTRSAPSTSSKANNVFGDRELLDDIEKATGKQLVNRKKRGRRDEMESATVVETSRERIQKKIFNRSSLKRVAATQSAIDDMKHKKKFGGQWQYVFRDQ